MCIVHACGCVSCQRAVLGRYATRACARPLQGSDTAVCTMHTAEDVHVCRQSSLRSFWCWPAAELQQHFVKVDVTSWESQVAMFTTALAILPEPREIDVVITSAGTPGSATWNMKPCSPGELIERGEQILAPSTSCLSVGLIGCMNTAYLGAKYAMGLKAPALSNTNSF